jgi:hypothetical protein
VLPRRSRRRADVLLDWKTQAPEQRLRAPREQRRGLHLPRRHSSPPCTLNANLEKKPSHTLSYYYYRS